MTFFYLDAGLVSNAGHHANSCRLITAELARRGVPYRVFGHVDCEDSLREELKVEPLFRVSPYWLTDAADEVTGWLGAFLASSEMTRDDLGQQWGHPVPERGDIIYWNSAQAAQLMALAEWWPCGLGYDSAPHLFVEMGTDPGLRPVNLDGQIRFVVPDPRMDGRAHLYQFVGRHLKSDRLHVVTFDEEASKCYAELLKRPVQTLPVPRERVAADRARAHEFPRIGFLGSARGEKGSHLVPEIIKQVLLQQPRCSFLVHTGDGGDDSTNAQLRHMQNDGRIIVEFSAAHGSAWSGLLRACDLIVLPYDPVPFRFRYSSIACEALASGIPMVVTGATSMAVLVKRFGAGAYVAALQTPECIAGAVVAALKDYDKLLPRSLTAAKKWEETMGVGRMVDGIMRLAMA